MHCPSDHKHSPAHVATPLSATPFWQDPIVNTVQAARVNKRAHTYKSRSDQVSVALPVVPDKVLFLQQNPINYSLYFS